MISGAQTASRPLHSMTYINCLMLPDIIQQTVVYIWKEKGDKYSKYDSKSKLNTAINSP